MCITLAFDRMMKRGLAFCRCRGASMEACMKVCLLEISGSSSQHVLFAGMLKNVMLQVFIY